VLGSRSAREVIMSSHFCGMPVVQLRYHMEELCLLAADACQQHCVSALTNHTAGCRMEEVVWPLSMSALAIRFLLCPCFFGVTNVGMSNINIPTLL
jgi:hypothetical protein